MNTKVVEFPNVEPAHMEDLGVTLFGCGGVGHPLAALLVSWGIPRITLCDNDYVEERNVLGRHAQGYSASDTQKSKVIRLKRKLLGINPRLKVSIRRRRILKPEILSGIVFACVDNMEGREVIRDSCFQSPEVKLLVEARITDASGRVFALDPSNIQHRAEYSDPSLWYTTAEADNGGCGSPTMFPLTAHDAARIMAGAVFSFLRRKEGSREDFINVTRFGVYPSQWTVEEVWC